MRRSKYVVLTFIVASMIASYNFSTYANEKEESGNDFSTDAVVITDTNKEKSETTVKEEPKKEEKKDEKATDSKFPIEGSVQATNLRLRQWPWGPVLGKYNTGDKVTVTGEDGEFYQVTINGVSGYMHKNYVSIPGAAASGIAPHYPGDTASGGYLSKEEGTEASKNPGKSSSGNSNYDWTDAANATESKALENYKGGKLSPKEFISLFGPVAKASMKETGVPASVTLAQAILETGWGGSTIGDAKNLFGIKGTGPAGSINTRTREVYSGNSVYITDGFRKYYTWQQSIDDHARLVSQGRYKSAWDQFQRDKNADAFARGIHNAGYATDPNYASTLISLMKQYNLYQWDN